MEKIFIVTSGMFSDYHICGAFSTRELAQALADDMNKGKESDHMDWANIEEWQLDADMSAKAVYYVIVNEFGEEEKRWTFMQRPFQLKYKHEGGVIEIDDKGRVHSHSLKGYDDALRIARDRLAQIKAEKAGV